MIAFQSLAIVRSSSYRPCHSPSPGGSNERGECRFVCCSGVGRDEGELYSRGRQSALMPCPSGTFENSLAIYGWVRRLLITKSPEGTTEIIIGLSGLKYRSVFIGVHPWLKTNFCKASFKVPQGQSRLFKATQTYSRVFGKKRLFIFYGPDWAPVFPTREPRKHSRFRGVPSCPKVFQTVPSLFSEKKIVYFLPRRSLVKAVPQPFALQPSISPVS
jgi:hypothetical protein